MPFFHLSLFSGLFLALLLTQALIFLVTVYFHRAMAHRSVTLKPWVNRICRFLSWFMMGMDPKEFAAVHRKHHAFCDTDQDPHTPAKYGWNGVLFKGVKLYQNEASKKETIEKYGKGLPVDPFESFYHRHPNLGILSFGLLLTLLFGFYGTLIWGVCLAWIPFWAAGVVNGLGHAFGYRRFPTEDLSTNLFPLGLWIGGEELHNNHHARPSSPKFSSAWYEFDLGWGYICLLKKMNLATVRHHQINIEEKTGFAKLLADRYQGLRALHIAFGKETHPILKSFGFSNWTRFSKQVAKQNGLAHQALKDPYLAKCHRLEESLKSLWNQRLPPQQLKKQCQEWLEEAKLLGPHLKNWCQSWLAEEPVFA